MLGKIACPKTYVGPCICLLNYQIWSNFEKKSIVDIEDCKQLSKDYFYTVMTQFTHIQRVVRKSLDFSEISPKEYLCMATKSQFA